MSVQEDDNSIVTADDVASGDEEMEKSTIPISKSNSSSGDARGGNNNSSSSNNNSKNNNNYSNVKGFDYRMEGSNNSGGFDYRDNHDSFSLLTSPMRKKRNNINSININNNNDLNGSGNNLNGALVSSGGAGGGVDVGPTSSGIGGGGGGSGGEANGFSIELQFLPPDQRPGLPGDLLAHVVEPEIEDDTEAAEALRANASIKVGKVGKVARSVNAQTVRRLVKRATLRGHGNKRGKPPRVPPGLTGSQAAAMSSEMGHRIYLDDDGNQAYVVQEGGYESDSQDYDLQGSVASSDGSVDDDNHHHQQQHHMLLQNQLEHHQKSDDNVATVQVPREKVEDSVPVGIPELGIGGSPPREPGPSRRASRYRADRYTSVMTGEDQKDIPTEVVAATMEAGRKLMGALDPHNMLQVQRWRRKKKGGKKQRKSYVKGKVIDGRHELYTLSIAVMLGVRTSIARTNTIISSSDGPGKRMLSPQDFMAEEKYEFAPKGSATTPPHKLSHTFKFKDYAPVAFAYLRRMFGVNEFDFLLSVCGNANFIEFISNAKSGQFFFYSSDGKYMIKTMTNAESKFLRRILPHYFRHCTQNPNTLLTKFLGMYRVKLYHLRRNVKFVIMNSVYYTDKSLQTFFDLKGSEIGRSAKPDQDVLKDNDLRAKLPEEAFSFSPDLRRRLRNQVESDCRFLEKMQVMDYSMLIGVHHIPPTKVDQHSNIAETGFKVQEHRSARHLTKKQILPSDHDHDIDTSGGTHNSAIPTLNVSGGESVTSNRGTRVGAENSKESLPADGSLLAAGSSDSTRRILTDIREKMPYSASNFEFAGLLEDEDDCSYLEGSDTHCQKHAKKIHAYQQHPKYDDVEMKKEQTIEQIYWPFHRFYDINGYRRMKPKECYRCGQFPCACEGISDMIQAWGIPEFTPPLSDRKDGGLVMDTTGMSHPMVFHGRQGDMLYEGKIYFMGIIDILQQYNARKRVETTYRKIEVRGRAEPSCVSPKDYADRFIRFFDEYSVRAHQKEILEVSESEWASGRIDNELQASTSSDRGLPSVPSGGLPSPPSGGKDGNGSLGPAKVTPADDTKTGDHKVVGLHARPPPLKAGQKPTGKYVVT